MFMNELRRSAQISPLLPEIASLAVVVLLIVNAGHNPDAVSVRSLAAPLALRRCGPDDSRADAALSSHLLKLAPFRPVARYSYSIYIDARTSWCWFRSSIWPGLTGMRERSAPRYNNSACSSRGRRGCFQLSSLQRCC